jgi:hypothetical protein
MNDRTLVGTVPWMPGFLRNIWWLNHPVAAERLAALRISVGLFFLLDLLWMYAPHFSDYYGPGSLSEPNVFERLFQSPSWSWSLIHWLPPGIPAISLLYVGILSALGMIFGVMPRLSACVGWMISYSLLSVCPFLHNGGDRVKCILMFILMLTPCDAAWVIGRKQPPAVVHPWWMVLLIMQMCLMYCLNGLRKYPGPEWRSGEVLYYVCNSSLWAHWSGQSHPVPMAVYKLLTWFTLVWEIFFPIFLWMPITRKAILWIGAFFHVFTFFHLEVGMFAIYALCFYTVFVPWERLSDWLKKSRVLESEKNL